MVVKKSVLTAASTLAIALGIGFVMQKGETAQLLYGNNTPPAEAETETGESVLDVQAIELTAADDLPQAVEAPIIPKQDLVVLASVPTPELALPEETDAMPAEPDCEISLDARPMKGAMVNLSLASPCQPNERLTVHHAGMMFTETTNENGGMNIVVPALQKEAVFIVAFAIGDGAVAQVEVDDLDAFDRTVLQWRGKNAFSLHAREFGADYGSDGHIWGGADRDLSGIASGDSGFMFQMGDVAAGEPLLAEVYTFPSSRSSKDGTIYLSVEAEVTDLNCGAEIEAQTLERQIDGSIKSQDLILSVPDCSAVGDFLVLNNLVSDLKVAAVE